MIYVIENIFEIISKRLLLTDVVNVIRSCHFIIENLRKIDDALNILSNQKL